MFSANPECRKRLDSQSITDHDGEAYCQHCYKKLFGPKGYGFGIGAGTLSMERGNEIEMKSAEYAATVIATNSNNHRSTSSLSPNIRRLSSPNTADRNDICPRCGLVVYDAEKMVAAGAVSVHSRLELNE